MMEEALKVYEKYIASKGIRKSGQRETILDFFLRIEKHISVAELYRIISRKYPKIGQATIYRSMKIFCDAGLADEIDLGDGLKRYEHKYGHDHHDHLYCIRCGNIIEVQNPGIEALQEEMCREHRFTPKSHKLQIFGYCSKCITRVSPVT